MVVVVVSVFFATMVIALRAISIATRGSTRENGIVIIGKLATGVARRMVAILVLLLLLLPFQFQAVNGLF